MTTVETPSLIQLAHTGSPVSNPSLLPNLFVRSTHGDDGTPAFLPVRYTLDGVAVDVKRTKLYDMLQKLLVVEMREYREYRQDDNNVRENLHTVRSVMSYINRRQVAASIKSTADGMVLALQYPNGWTVTAMLPETLARDTARNRRTKHGVVLVGDLGFQLAYTVHHTQWPQIDVNPMVADWLVFNRHLTEDFRQAMFRIHLPVVFMSQ